MAKKCIESANAPRPLGPYSPALMLDSLVFVSGQVGIDPVTQSMHAGIEAQTRAALGNIQNLLKEAGLGMDAILKTTIFLAKMEDFALVNSIYETFFTKPYPARSTIAVAGLPKSGLVEIEAIAHR